MIFADNDFSVLERSLKQRLKAAHRPGTKDNLRSQFRLYLLFCQRYHLQDIDPDVNTLCLYAEFLARSFKSFKSLFNYLCAVNTLHKILDIPCSAYDSFKFQMMKKALGNTMLHITRQKDPITPRLLLDLCQVSQPLAPMGRLFKCLFTLAFFSFLRCSNLLPPSARTFDPTRHLCRGDVIVQPDCLVVIIKWSKTHQKRDKLHTIALTAMPGSPACPVQAFKDYTAASPAAPNTPLFSYRQHGHQVALSAARARKVLHFLLGLLGHTASDYSMHSFRRGGCTTAAHFMTDPLRIKQHGLWASNAYERYVTPDLTDKLIITKNMGPAFHV